MFLLTEGFRHALAVGLLVATLAVVLTLFGLVITRLLDERRFRLRQRLNARCQPLILAIMKPDAPNSARLRLLAEGRASPDVVSDLVLKTLENFGSRQLTSWWRLRGLVDFLVATTPGGR